MNEPSYANTATATIVLTDARRPNVDHCINGKRPQLAHVIRGKYTIYKRPRKIRRGPAA